MEQLRRLSLNTCNGYADQKEVNALDISFTTAPINQQ